MGKVKSFTLQLHDNKSVYYPGETVKGICELHVKDGVKINQISIELAGFGKVFWTQTRASGTRLGPVTEHFTSEVEYVRAKQELPFPLDRSDCESGEKRHIFAFTFMLPINLVTSFEGKFGYVRYFLKADLVRPWPRAISVKKYITVIKPIDTNGPQYQRSIAATDETEICCFCCNSGSIQVTAQTDRAAYCPGESIAITARFQNNSLRTVKPFAVLCQTQKYHAKGLTQSVTYRLAMLTGLPLKGRQSAAWDCQLVRLPPVSPSILNSALIEVHYCIKVGLVVPYCRDVRVTLPIVVGTVPFRQIRPSPVTAAAVVSTPVVALPPAYNTLPPEIPQTAQPSHVDTSSDVSYSDPPPAYVESILAGGYLSDDDDDDENYNSADVEVNEDDDEQEVEPVVAQVSRDKTNPTGTLGAELSRCGITTAPTSNSWWRRFGESSHGSRTPSSVNSEEGQASNVVLNANRRQLSTGHRNVLYRAIAASAPRDEPGPSSAVPAQNSNRRFAPLCPYVAYPPPPSYNEVMGSIAEIPM